MIDLEKEKQEQELFKQKMLNEHSDYENEEEFEKDKHGDFFWIGTDSDFTIWQMCAEEKQAEINDLKQKLAHYENPDYVLLPRSPNELMINTYRDSSLSPVSTLSVFGYKAMIEAVEKDHE